MTCVLGPDDIQHGGGRGSIDHHGQNRVDLIPDRGSPDPRGGCGSCMPRPASTTRRSGRSRTHGRLPPPRNPAKPSTRRPVRRLRAPPSSTSAYPSVGDQATFRGGRGSSRVAIHDASGRGRERRSVGSGPTATSRAVTTSERRRASGPFVDRFCQSGGSGPPLGTRPSEGFIPDSPQHDDGMRIEPPPSDPVAKGTIPEAMAAALPPDDPPGVCSRFQGFRVWPNTRFCGIRLPSELRGVGLAHNDAPGRDQPGHQWGVGTGRWVVGEHRRAVGGDVTGGVLEILHAERDAGQRSGIDAGRHLLVDCLRGGAALARRRPTRRRSVSGCGGRSGQVRDRSAHGRTPGRPVPTRPVSPPTHCESPWPRPYRWAIVITTDPGARHPTVSTTPAIHRAVCAHDRIDHRWSCPRSRRPCRAPVAGRVAPVCGRPGGSMELGRPRGGFRSWSGPVRQRGPDRAAHALRRRVQRLPQSISHPARSRATPSDLQGPRSGCCTGVTRPRGLRANRNRSKRPSMDGGVRPSQPGHRCGRSGGSGRQPVVEPGSRRLSEGATTAERRLGSRATGLAHLGWARRRRPGRRLGTLRGRPRRAGGRRGQPLRSSVGGTDLGWSDRSPTPLPDRAHRQFSPAGLAGRPTGTDPPSRAQRRRTRHAAGRPGVRGVQRRLPPARPDVAPHSRSRRRRMPDCD